MSYDIALVSSGYDMTIRFWSEISSGTQCKYTVEHKDNAINALEMTPAKDKVAFASGNSIKFLDLHKLSPNPVLSIDSHEGLLSTILFPELLKDLVITGGEDCSIRISDMRVGKVVKSFFHSNYVNSLAIGNNNKDIIAADENGTIKIWDTKKDEMRNEYNPNVEEKLPAFRSISLAKNDEFLVGGKSNGNICIFDLKNNDNESQNLSQPKTFKAHDRYITKCLLSPENNILATCSADKELKLWERKNLKNDVDNIQNNSTKNLSFEFDLLKIFKKHTKWVWDCDFTVDSQYILSCSSDRTIKLWEIKTGKMIANIEDEHGGINNIILCD